MSPYFLKKTKNKKGPYLQVYESHWDPERGHTANRSVRAMGYGHELGEPGIADPIARFRAEVDPTDAERRAAVEASKAREIGPGPAERHLGHFAIKAVDDALGVAHRPAPFALQPDQGRRQEDFGLHARDAAGQGKGPLCQQGGVEGDLIAP